MNKKYLVIGDLHGRHYGLNALINNITQNLQEAHKEITLVFIGDYIDHFDESNYDVKKTIDLLLELNKKYDCIFLLGNHDLWMLEWITQGNIQPYNLWWIQGGRETLYSYGITGPLVYNTVKSMIPESHIEFFKLLKPYYYNDGMVVVHGGFDRKVDMIKMKLNAPLEDFGHYEGKECKIYNILWDRTFYISTDRSLLNDYREIFGDRLFICGHTPYEVTYMQYIVKRLLIDSNAKDGKYLSSALINGNEIESIITETGIDKIENIL